MKRVLVISDNPVLAEFIMSLIHTDGLCQYATFEFRYSASNKSPSVMISLGFDSINLKDYDVVDNLICNYDLILSIHCKQIFPLKLVSCIRCINLHPGFNPYNRGWYPQVFSIINKKPIGATLHVMTENIDAGPIIAQQSVHIDSSDTSMTLYEKVRKIEFYLLKKYLKLLIDGNVEFDECQFQGNINSLSDFKNLCKLDVDSVGTLREHIDLLRALTHGEFQNAFFIDDSGVKVYIKLHFISEDAK